MTPEEAKLMIIDPLREQRKNAYAQNDQVRAQTLSTVLDQVHDWIDEGMRGSLPVNLTDYGITIEIPGRPASSIQHKDEEVPTATVIAVPASDSVSSPDQRAATRREVERIEEQARLRREAKAAEAAGDVTGTVTLWRQLLELSPDDPDARRGSQQYIQQLANQPVKTKLLQLRSKLNSMQISDLDAGLLLARDLLSSGQLEEAMLKEVQDLESKLHTQRAQLKAMFGEVETLAALGQLSVAIKRLEELIKSGVFEFENREGRKVSASDELATLNREYATFCTNKAQEYLERANQSLPAFPKAAANVLEQALKDFDKADPNVIAGLQQHLLQVKDLIERWTQAQALVGVATVEKDPEKRLGLFEHAFTIYSGVENLDDLLEAAREDAASAIIRDVQTTLQEARLARAEDKRSEALTVAKQAVDRSKHLKGVSAKLDQVIEEVQRFLTDLERDAIIQQVVSKIRTLAGKHDFLAADDEMNTLPDEIGAHREIKLLRNEISRARGVNFVFVEAQRRYGVRDYAGVLELLEAREKDVGAETLQLDERLRQLREQALAHRAYQKALELLRDDPLAAESYFEQARQTDRSLEADVIKHLDTIAQWRSNTFSVRTKIATAQKLKETDLGQAYQVLKEAKEVESLVKSQAQAEWLEVRRLWSEQLYAQMKQAPLGSELAFSLAQKQHSEEMLDTAEQRAQVESVERAYYRSEALKASQSGVRNWPRAQKCWEAYLKLDPGNTDALVGLREALSEQQLAAAKTERGTSKDTEKALAILEEGLRNSYLQGDSLYLIEMVSLACEYGQFERAGYYLTLLRAVERKNLTLVEATARLLQQMQAWDEARRSSDIAFKEEHYASAVRVLDDVMMAYPDSSRRSEWQLLRDNRQRRAVSALLDKARELKGRTSGTGRVEIITLYSQVIQLVGTGNNREAEDGIKDVQNELPELVRNVTDEADRFNPEGQDPTQALADADRQLTRLNDFRTLVAYMPNEADRNRRNIEAAATKLGNQRDQLNRVVTALRQVRETVANPVDDLKISNAEDALKLAKREITRVVGLAELEGELKKAKEERIKLKDLIKTLKENARDDETPRSYQVVQENCRALRQLDPENRYQLLTAQNLDVYYDFLDQHTDTLEQHEELARRRQENYRLYSEWLKRCTLSHEALLSTLEEVDDKRQKAALDALKEALDRALNVAERGLEEFGKPPTAEPVCLPADDIKEQIREWESEAGRSVFMMRTERTEVEEKLARRAELDAELVTLLKRRPTPTLRNQAENRLKNLRALDPHWLDLAEREHRLQSWKSQRSGILSRFQ